MEKLIYQKLAAILKGTKAIGKNSRNLQQNFNFRGIDDVMNEMHNLFAENGVVIIPVVLDYTVTTETTAKGGKLFFTRARIEHHFTAEDGSEVVSTTIGEAMDSGDKGMNKAMSIALKYAMLQIFLIPTKEDKDPDAHSYEVLSAPSSTSVNSADMSKAINEVKGAATQEDLFALWQKYTTMNPTLGAGDSEFCKEWIKRRGELG